jgi:hypothetical protein
MPATLTSCPKISAGESFCLPGSGDEVCCRRNVSATLTAVCCKIFAPLFCAFITTRMEPPHQSWDSRWNQRWNGLDCNKNGSDMLRPVKPGSMLDAFFVFCHPRYLLACGNPCCQCGAPQYTGPAWCIVRPCSPYSWYMLCVANKCKLCVYILLQLLLYFQIVCMQCNAMQCHAMPCNAMQCNVTSWDVT